MDQSQLLTVNGIETFAYIEGEGPPFIMLHGMAATSECWAYPFDHFKQHYTVIAPDLPGHGLSSEASHPYSVEFYVEWLGDLLDELAIEEPIVLMGNSMGGAISLAFTKQYPQQVERLVLVDPLGVSDDFPWRSAGRLISRLPDGIQLTLTGEAEPHLFNYVKDRVVVNPRDEKAKPILERMATKNLGKSWSLLAGLRLVFVDFFDPNKRREFANQLQAINVPTLVTWGRHDGLLPVDYGAAARQTLPHADMIVFEESAHMPMVEEPERFNAAVEDFLG